jgi:branched-chain amino acid transport system substrate-binding protein
MLTVVRTALAVTLAAMMGMGSAAVLADGISANVVKIGVLTDMSGQFSHESGEGAVTAVRMAIEDFGGNVLGKPIELVVADHQNKPDIALGIARKWFDVENVDMIANLINSSIALGVTQLAKDKDRIAIVNGSGASRLTGDACTPNSIHYAYDTYSLAKGTGTAMMKAVERAGISSRRIMRLVMRSKPIRRPSSRRSAVRCWARRAIRSRPRINPRSCCRRRRRRQRWWGWQAPERFLSMP